MDADPRAEEARSGHAVHALAPAVLEYVPAGHRTHVLALLAPETPEYAPAGHETHALALLAPVTLEYAPALQFAHAVPETTANFPAAHAVHTPFTLTEPRPHGHVYASK